MNKKFFIFTLMCTCYSLFGMQAKKNPNCSHEQLTVAHITRYTLHCPAGQLPYGLSAAPNYNCKHLLLTNKNNSTKYIAVCPKGQPPFVKK